ncbi:hypothetical protein QBC35DRAFT_185539 [Podospora australis]|uniref:Uncharacterized protein n=1 Tax=Podospora australis TaxID=1536484 RepID=A0AAN7AJB7_9PEZI|nr:hypothetical protein QBC35DRAFT_185539 [Podospora australis]
MMDDEWEQQYMPPYEQRDQEDQAEAWYNQPLRTENRRLTEEVMRLKKLLRENQISWSPLLTLDPEDPTRGAWASTKKASSRSSLRRRSGLQSPRLPTLPNEIMVMIIKYAMTSNYPIIDPLFKSNANAMTAPEKNRPPQLAVGFLATCSAFNAEATRYLWSNNMFVFTSHLALQNFSNLDLKYRRGIKHITMRIIARYYDDEDHVRKAPFPSWSTTRETIRLRVIRRFKESTMARRGFRSYTWNQVIDFLDVLRPPYDPNHNKNEPRPRLLPGLESLRMDLVNFPADYLTAPGGQAIHNLAAHDLASTLNELQLTGITDCQWGVELSSQLSRLVKDDGLLLKADSTYVLTNTLRRKSPNKSLEWQPRVVRAWKALAEEYLRQKAEKKDEANDGANNNSANSSFALGLHVMAHHHHGGHHSGLTPIPPVPVEEGAPKSQWKERRTLWKRVPVSRDARDEDRRWVEFDRTTGQPIDPDEYDDEDADTYDMDDLVCHHCGVMHSPYEEDY